MPFIIRILQTTNRGRRSAHSGCKFPLRQPRLGPQIKDLSRNGRVKDLLLIRFYPLRVFPDIAVIQELHCAGIELPIFSDRALSG